MLTLPAPPGAAYRGTYSQHIRTDIRRHIRPGHTHGHTAAHTDRHTAAHTASTYARGYGGTDGELRGERVLGTAPATSIARAVGPSGVASATPPGQRGTNGSASAALYVGLTRGRTTNIATGQGSVDYTEADLVLPGTDIGELVLRVGTHIQPGVYTVEYKSSSRYGCIIQRLSGLQYTEDEVIWSVERYGRGRIVLDIDPSDVAVRFQYCNWT